MLGVRNREKAQIRRAPTICFKPYLKDIKGTRPFTEDADVLK